jgi:branched-chain amino acid transport system ATP-binding protein
MVLRLRGLSWSVGGARIVDGVDLEVADGEFVAVIGPNGAGKTSLFNLVSGLIRPTGGTVELDGRDINAAAPHRRARLGLGRTFQVSSVFPTMTVAAHVALATRIGARTGSARDDAILERVRLGHRSDQLAGSLSHGDKRKLELALLLASGSEARLLLLDEPMAGVGAEEVPELVAVIRALHRDEGHSVLMIEHHMDVLLGLADRVAVMHHGALLAVGSPAEVMADPLVQEAYLGDAL